MARAPSQPWVDGGQRVGPEGSRWSERKDAAKEGGTEGKTPEEQWWLEEEEAASCALGLPVH
jgi:hypothetical protein